MFCSGGIVLHVLVLMFKFVIVFLFKMYFIVFNFVFCFLILLKFINKFCYIKKLTWHFLNAN